MKNKNSGFTLLEILLVVGIIAILAGIVIVAINPSKQLATVRNTERKSDIKQIHSALEQYYIDNGKYPTTTPSVLTPICKTGSGTYGNTGVTCDTNFDLSILVPTYITAIPADPQSTTVDSGYSFMQDSTTHKLIITAPNAELDQVIAIGTTTGGGGGGGSSTLGDGLVTHYLMNDTDGTAVLDTKSHNGSGSYTHVVGHVGSGALSFDGTSEAITVANSSNIISHIFSIAYWVNPNSSQGPYPRILNFGLQTGNGFNVRHGVPGPGLEFYGTGQWIYSNTETPSNDWTHVVFTCDENMLVKMYVNGIYESSLQLNGTPWGGESDMVIGAQYGSDLGDLFFHGFLDDVRIYNRVLNQTEISALAAGTEVE